MCVCVCERGAWRDVWRVPLWRCVNSSNGISVHSILFKPGYGYGRSFKQSTDPAEPARGYWNSIAAKRNRRWRQRKRRRKSKKKQKNKANGNHFIDVVDKVAKVAKGNMKWKLATATNGNPQVRVKENKTLCKCATLAVKWNSPWPNYTWCLMSWLAIAVNWNKRDIDQPPSTPCPPLALPINFCFNCGPHTGSGNQRRWL